MKPSIGAMASVKVQTQLCSTLRSRPGLGEARHLLTNKHERLVVRVEVENWKIYEIEGF